MPYSRAAAVAALSMMLLGPLPTMAAEPVGEAVLIKTEVTGGGGPIAVDTPVHRDERIKTSQSGLGQFLFRDGTKLAVGWGSSVTIDKFVYDDTSSVKNLTIKAAKGTFRWVSGNSKSSAYNILTPAGTIGVRGTAFDFYVGPDGTTAVVLLNGSARFCGAGGCKELKRRCDCVVAKPNGRITDTRRVDRNIFKTLGSTKALPFLSGNQKLSGGLGITGTGCGLSMAAAEPADNGSLPPARAPGPAPQSPRAPDPPAPQSLRASDPPAAAPSDAPDPPATPRTPDTPSKPDKPDKPDKHHHHDRHHDKDGHHHDRHDDDRRGRDRHDHDRGRDNRDGNGPRHNR
ncbi:FecR family protein [Phyllobacterium chamaecytisi]|uniref:FecR family protein n=1 Tax=Phyllobacterium chamaecytisi TaxID=2876082 RepID=UPI001CCE8C5B|nr:FecR domain-containing protein [Phyllobacterium sp. KW56]MBZ9602419.1 FecR domain-containing protein [Phyllobacterium sp. KW56]